ncbi:hypothetical protein OIU84_020715 [Salix udensis]|uniref:Membrane lipoprotein n=1 Tax=Salix udensis TaxID=889485 RepID=A0AAD6KUH0_9ROSI|nr:hypothetical protein OIU84_020715 [Salix udensis]
MKSLSSVGLGLSIVFGCLLLALFAELYYLLWWKKRFANKDDYSSPARELFFMFCLRKPSSLRNSQELCSSVRITDALVHHEQESQLNSNTGKDILLRPWSDDSVEADLMRLHSLSGSRSRSLSDLLRTVETPYLTPLSSPPFFTPPLTPSCNQIGFNHLFESSKDAEFNKIRSSPPPKFKFLQDADEKLHRRKLMQETEEKNNVESWTSASGGLVGVICCLHSSCLSELSDICNHSGLLYAPHRPFFRINLDRRINI